MHSGAIVSQDWDASAMHRMHQRCIGDASDASAMHQPTNVPETSIKQSIRDRPVPLLHAVDASLSLSSSKHFY
jgi:hypothetical protein